MRVRTYALLFLQVWLTACSAPPTATGKVAAETAAAQQVVVEAALPAIVDIREAVAQVAPPAPPPSCVVHPAAVDLIVRFEVTSPEYYTARLQGVIWPGAHSGVTWGVGFDGGHQTKTYIADVWKHHPQVDRLMTTSGVVGEASRDLLPRLHDVRTPYPLAAEAFVLATLPSFCELTKRAFRDGWDGLSPYAQGALVATVYNRGAAMGGDRRAEMRALKDDCVPRNDAACMAGQFRTMGNRLWIGTPEHVGLKRRYDATAALAERT